MTVRGFGNWLRLLAVPGDKSHMSNVLNLSLVSEQKTDESADSFIARVNVIWTELLPKQISLDQVQAYVLLRGSRLASEDKKSVCLWSQVQRQRARSSNGPTLCQPSGYCIQNSFKTKLVPSVRNP